MSEATDPRPISINGNITWIEGLKKSGGGVPYLKFGVAQNRRVQEDGQWVDGEPVYWTVSVFRDQAEHAARSLEKGDRVVVKGKLQAPREYTRDDGSTGTADHDIAADEVGVSLLFTTVLVNRIERQLEERGVGREHVGVDF